MDIVWFCIILYGLAVCVGGPYLLYKRYQGHKRLKRELEEQERILIAKIERKNKLYDQF